MVTESEPILLSDAGVSTREASRQLGISTEAVRKRVKRDTLRGVKVGNRWKVVVEESSDTILDYIHGQKSNELSDIAHFLYDEVLYLRQQLEESNRERGELRQLAGQAQMVAAHVLALQMPFGRLPALPAGSTATNDAETPAAPAAPVRREDPLAAMLQRRSPAGPKPETGPTPSAARESDPVLAAMRQYSSNGSSHQAPKSETRKPNHGDESAEIAPRLAALDSAIARYVARGWRLVTKLDVRAELAQHRTGERLYLEAGPNGAIAEQRL